MSKRLVLSCSPILAVVMVFGVATPPDAAAQVEPYNPYAVTEPAPVPVSPEGKIQWGIFYKSAAVQRKYEHLWNLGACRGTFKGITAQVGENKLRVDELPESHFTGTVRATAGGLAGGMIAFARSPDSADPPLVVQLHPAGVTRLSVTGTASPAILQPGMTVRVATRVDSDGKAVVPVTALDIISPVPRSELVDVVPGVKTTVVGIVTHVHRNMVGLRVDTGRVRRLTLPLVADATVAIDAAATELLAGGDAIDVTGRLWSGPGSLGAGTVFASEVVVRKPGSTR